MEQKAVCGGFLVGDGLEIEGKTLKATGGSGGKTYVTVVSAIHGSTYFVATYYGVSANSVAELPDYTVPAFPENGDMGNKLPTSVFKYNGTLRCLCTTYGGGQFTTSPYEISESDLSFQVHELN